MAANSIIQYFIPKDTKFYLLFEEASSNLVKISNELYEAFLTTDKAKRLEHIRQVEKLEHVCDETTHKIFQAASNTFITPFDREDIQRLASGLDDIADFINGAAKRVDLYKVDEIHHGMLKLAELIVQSCEQMHIAVTGLKSRRHYDEVRTALVKVNSLENHADDIFEVAIAKLFEDETNAIEVIKIKEILSTLETATDKCEDAAHLIESVIVKFT
jgi:predicted phosphate transport protein (TIGR00153 family)